MKLEIEVISKEIIKPSSPTRDDLFHYKLSFLDQVSIPVYNPVVLFYPTDGLENLEKYNELKKSLSKALECYYPLAGRLKDNLFVECNDEGILCSKVNVSCTLLQVLENPVPSELNKLLPFKLDGAQDILLGVQFNAFECGGVCISLCLSHKVADGLSTLMFVKTWAEITRGEENFARPDFISASLFPPKIILGVNPANYISKEKITAKSFVFSHNSIETLRQKYASRLRLEDGKMPSRVQALSAFIWSRFMASTSNKEAENPPKTCLVFQAVNLRPRMDPPLSDSSFGNYSRFAITVPPINYEQEKYDLIDDMRDSIRKIDKEYVKRLQQGNEHLDFMKERGEKFMKGEISTLNFTSLCGLPLYEADFGWGKPIWFSSTNLTFKNLIVFKDAASGDGIEAVVHLKEEDMVRFQHDEEFRQFVTC